MKNGIKELTVTLHGKQIGTLTQDESGKLSFAYSENTLPILSLSLDSFDKEYADKECRAYFGGLLPEGEEVRKYIGRRYSVNPKNEFALLKAIGKDCAGAVSFYTPEEIIFNNEPSELMGTPISDKVLAQHIKDLPQKPLFLDIRDFKLSLAGAQDKAAISIIGNQICIPALGQPTTHILKPVIQKCKESIENECLCLKTAKSMGIETPNVEIRTAEDVSYLLIERYDRQIANKIIKRIHQEDFCQALGVNSSIKYQNEGGPSFKDCFELLKKTSTPAADRLKLAERLVFNFLVGNTDAHAKNFSLLHNDNGTINLAPMYDVLCVPIYDENAKKMAMKIGGHYEYEDTLPRHWERLCNEIGFSYPQLKKIILKQAKELPAKMAIELENLKQQGHSTIIALQILGFVTANCNRTLKRFEQ